MTETERKQQLIERILSKFDGLQELLRNEADKHNTETKQA